MRVVVSVGTDHHPFVRLLQWSVEACDRAGADLWVQAGSTKLPVGVAGIDFVGATELADRMRDADAVICHGGPGTIAGARSAGHVPIVVPRDDSLGEHVDDHQQRYAARLAAAGSIDVARSVDDIVGLLAAPRRSDVVGDATPTEQAVDQFADLVDRLLLGRLPRRRWSDRFRVRRTARGSTLATDPGEAS